MTILEFLFSAPTYDWIRFAGFFVGIILFIAVAEKTRVALGWPPEVNRKLVHILTGVLIYFTPFFFVSNKPLIWMAVIFIVVNYIGVKTEKLKGMHDTQRRSYGTVFYPLTFLVLVVLCWQNHKTILMLSMLVLALSDAAAAIVGENIKHPHEYFLGRDKKSIEGSAVMFATSFLIVCLLLPHLDTFDGLEITWAMACWIGLVTAIVATALEALSSSGSDNLSAPLGSAFVMSFFLGHSAQMHIQFSIGLGLALTIAVVSYWIGFLTASGSVGTFLLATLVFGVGGWIWTAPILTFFVISSLLSKLGKAHKAQFAHMFDKSSRREIGQVLANGGVAGFVILLYNYFPNPIWFVIYLGGLAAVNSDTWGTEIGVFSRNQPRSIKNFQKVPPGTSGGISLLGTISALTGAFTIALCGWIVAPPDFYFSIGRFPFWVVVGAGLLASLIDSLLGTTLQAQYCCPACEKITEKKRHCGQENTLLVSGHTWLNNDLVNVCCSFSGAFLAWTGMELFSR